jgi:hypothetical protein
MSYKGNVIINAVNACQVDGKSLFLPLFWDRMDLNPSYWWALRYRIYQWRQCLSGGWQVFFSSPLHSVKLVQRLKMKIRKWPWDISYNCRVWMTEPKSEKFELFENVIFWHLFFCKELPISQHRDGRPNVKFNRQHKKMHIYWMIPRNNHFNVACGRDRYEKPPQSDQLGVVSKMASHPRKLNFLGISR